MESQPQNPEIRINPLPPMLMFWLQNKNNNVHLHSYLDD